MKWDIKVFVVYILTILVFGGSYMVTDNSFALLPLHYIDLPIAILAFVFVFTTPFSQYTPLLFLFGGSLTYMLFGIYEREVAEFPTVFEVVRNLTILSFAIFLLVRVFRGKDKNFRGLFLFFGLMVLMQIMFNGIDFSSVSQFIIDLIKVTLGFALTLLVFREIQLGNELNLAIKRMFILVGLYLFRCLLFLLVDWN